MGRPVVGWHTGEEVPPICDCGLWHLPDNHAKPAAIFATPDRCASCVRLRCDRPEECAYPPVGARRVLEESR